MTRSKMVSMLIVLLLLAACHGPPTTQPAAEVIGKQVSVYGGAYTDVSVAELQTMLANKDFTFVNVHIPFEGDIANTDLSIPYNEIAQNLQQLPAEKDAKIVFF